MYNPFFGQTFRATLSRVFDSYDRNPRKLHIVYQYPLEHNWLIASGRVVVENVRPVRYPAPRRWWEGEDEKVIVTYHVTGLPDAPRLPQGDGLLALRAAPAVALRAVSAARAPRRQRGHAAVERLGTVAGRKGASALRRLMHPDDG